MHAIAFYNLENLFDIFDNKFTDDNDFLPNSRKRWTLKRYNNKLRKLGFTIRHIGKEHTKTHPAIVGLAEVENALVITDLLNSKHLDELNYDFVHYNSPDERGIDTAMIYNKDVFTVVNSETFSINLVDEYGNPDYTRDILLVEGLLENELIYLLVNHWPSRREGADETAYKRIIASQELSKIIEGLQQKNSNAKIIVMGDFNDDPSCESIKQLIANNDLYNPMLTLHSRDRGTTNHKFSWNLFDQILFSTNFFEHNPDTFNFKIANIFDETFLSTFKGKFKGLPFRTYVGKRYKGGYSDHFPVYIILEK